MKAEEEIMDKPGFWDLPKLEHDALLKPVYDNWRHDLFSQESFERFLNEVHEAEKDSKSNSKL
jgi:hypothetical protein